ncbi:hypothetical protein AG1IA_06354 [Rhizoctonia solani AG-1 IA]|uniref:Uncharacterized protein n=1 Tax=Thanatephorus cucumeris (strain AG1-IA) TaxID=983506 RepID=L8WTA9_THACA|nr:hypothetical protein AG1IA_06354 [Rhizoctonia solani AG-1 IA]
MGLRRNNIGLRAETDLERMRYRVALVSHWRRDEEGACVNSKGLEEVTGGGRGCEARGPVGLAGHVCTTAAQKPTAQKPMGLGGCGCSEPSNMAYCFAIGRTCGPGQKETTIACASRREKTPPMFRKFEDSGAENLGRVLTRFPRVVIAYAYSPDPNIAHRSLAIGQAKITRKLFSVPMILRIPRARSKACSTIWSGVSGERYASMRRVPSLTSER